MAHSDDRALVEKRAALAQAAADVGAEIADRTILLERLTDDDERAREHVRLAELHLGGGDGAIAAAEAFAAAAACGHFARDPWRDAALASDDDDVLAGYLRHPEADADAIAPARLQSLIHASTALTNSEDREARLKVLSSLSAHTDDDKDLDAYLALIKVARPSAIAAATIAEHAIARSRGRWLLEAVELDDGDGREDDAYGRLASALSTSLEREPLVMGRLFERAAARGDLSRVDSAGSALLELEGLNSEVRARVLRERASLLKGAAPEAYTRALADLLDELPNDEDALVPLVEHLLIAGDLQGALARCRARAEADDSRSRAFSRLLARVAASAEERQAERAEIEARELLTSATADDVQLQVQLDRLTDLYEGRDDLERAAAVLERRLGVSGEEVSALKRLASLYRRTEDDDNLELSVGRWLEAAPADLEASDAKVCVSRGPKEHQGAAR